MTAVPEMRRLSCARCGAVFDCTRTQDCWCNEKSFRLPMPASDAEDCLCPTCLTAAAKLGTQSVGSKANNET
jgi:hypothetical protein